MHNLPTMNCTAGWVICGTLYKSKLCKCLFVNTSQIQCTLAVAIGCDCITPVSSDVDIDFDITSHMAVIIVCIAVISHEHRSVVGIVC